mmetsp:Transcript_80857/g.223665  ORF Transcript_80857/g.223665 Transcript_80857/m.223665 type:complete len:297 (+) Transcript_80857:910-1800(+)
MTCPQECRWSSPASRPCTRAPTTARWSTWSTAWTAWRTGPGSATRPWHPCWTPAAAALWRTTRRRARLNPWRPWLRRTSSGSTSTRSCTLRARSSFLAPAWVAPSRTAWSSRPRGTSGRSACCSSAPGSLGPLPRQGCESGVTSGSAGRSKPYSALPAPWALPARTGPPTSWRPCWRNRLRGAMPVACGRASCGSRGLSGRRSPRRALRATWRRPRATWSGSARLSPGTSPLPRSRARRCWCARQTTPRPRRTSTRRSLANWKWSRRLVPMMGSCRKSMRGRPPAPSLTSCRSSPW